MKRHSSSLCVLAILGCTIGAVADQLPPVPAFEVASIRPIEQPRSFSCGFPTGARFVSQNTTVGLIACAYSIEFALARQRIIGWPAWADDDWFEINANAPQELAGLPYRDRLKMLQTLLTTRFKLALHTESRSTPAYDLVLARGDRRPGAELRPTRADCVAWWTGGRRGAPPPVGDNLPCGRQMVSAGSIRGSAMTLAQLATILSPQVQRPVQDRSDLSGYFDLSVRWRPSAGPGAADSDALPPSVFTALEEQLGLKLSPIQHAIDVFVVDHLERPTPN